HPAVIIKDNCWIYQNVTIGANTRYKDGKLNNTGAPIIEHNTVIYSGAVIAGPIVVGANSVIGANCVVTRDVPANSLVYSSSAQVSKIKEGVEYITPKSFWENMEK